MVKVKGRGKQPQQTLAKTHKWSWVEFQKIKELRITDTPSERKASFKYSSTSANFLTSFTSCMIYSGSTTGLS